MKWIHLLCFTIIAVPTLVYAEPTPYTIDSKTGLESRSIERSIYSEVTSVMHYLRKAFNFNDDEAECAKNTLAKAIIQATKEALQDSIFGGLGGVEGAEKFFSKQDDDFDCKGKGRRGVEAMQPYASKATSVARPFIASRLPEVKPGTPPKLTPAEVAAIIAAAILALPALAPL